MQPDVLLKALKGIAEGFVQRSAKVEGKALANAAEVETLLAAPEWSSAQGWVARQSGVERHPSTATSLGAVLEAEIGTAGKSLQIRRLGGAWVRTLITETNGGAMLSDDVVLVTTLEDAKGNRQAARYRRYWTLPDCGAAEVTACRLVGFEGVEE